MKITIDFKKKVSVHSTFIYHVLKDLGDFALTKKTESEKIYKPFGSFKNVIGKFSKKIRPSKSGKMDGFITELSAHIEIER